MRTDSALMPPAYPAVSAIQEASSISRLVHSSAYAYPLSEIAHCLPTATKWNRGGRINDGIRVSLKTEKSLLTLSNSAQKLRAFYDKV